MLADGPKHIALLLLALRGGGSERALLDLAAAFRKRGHRVDLLVARLKGERASEIPDSVQIVELGTPLTFGVIRTLVRLPFDTWSKLVPAVLSGSPRMLRSLPRLERYLVEQRPDVLLASTYAPNLLALWAGALSRAGARIIIKQDNIVLQQMTIGMNPLERRLPLLMRRWYRLADAIIAVSDGIADDVIRVAGVPRERVNVIYNPVDLDRIKNLASQDLADPWFQAGQLPVLLAAGRLTDQKDYPTLLRAFAQLRSKRQMRLVILGEGPERPPLERLIAELGIGNDVRLPGFQLNPYSYMARSTLFVLSSAHEGLPIVLIEALACGCPVVTTDCPYGPADVLDHGRHGMLVPVRNPDALACAIEATLDRKGNPHAARQRAQQFGVDAIAEQYLSFFQSITNPNEPIWRR